MKYSIFNRYFLSIALVCLVLVVLLLYGVKYYFERDLEDEIRSGMEATAHLVSASLLSSGLDTTGRMLSESKGSESVKYRITIIGRDGTVLYDTNDDPIRMENHKDRPEFVEAIEGGTGFSKRYNHTMNVEMAYLAIPVVRQNEITEVIRVAFEISDIQKRIDRILRLIIICVIIFILITGLILFFLLKKMKRPLLEMLEVAEKIKKGYLSTRLLNPPTPEAEILYNTINDMLFKIETLIKENENKNIEFSSILSSIQEGLLIVDREANIVLANSKVSELFSCEQRKIEGMKIYEILKSPELNEYVQSASSMSIRSPLEIQIGNMVFLTSISYNRYNDTTIILLYDITSKIQTERYKRDLIAGVSHELRTPLTAIRGFIETIEEESDRSIQLNYLSIVKNHTDRLINIVNDLLTLSSVERQTELNLKECDINSIVEETLLIFEKPVREKKLLLVRDLQRVNQVRCDEYMISQVLINLVDNAIKYTDAGSIEVSTFYSGNNIVVEVKDTGTGIPEEHLDRIFERFYVVDRSRSRSRGGTGLGLSIVKNVIQRHNWKIQVRSEIGKGSSFQIIIPQN